jgi:hypothetical protein
MPCYVPGLLRLATDAQAHTEQLAVEPPPPPPFDNGAVSGSFSVIQLSVWLPVDQIATEMAPREEATPAHSPTRPPRRQSTSTLPTPTLAFYPFHPLTPASPPPPPHPHLTLPHPRPSCARSVAGASTDAVPRCGGARFAARPRREAHRRVAPRRGCARPHAAACNPTSPSCSPMYPGCNPVYPGAHAFMLLPRRAALERRLSDGLAFLDKCRLLAKVDGDGVEQLTYLHVQHVAKVPLMSTGALGSGPSSTLRPALRGGVGTGAGGWGAGGGGVPFGAQRPLRGCGAAVRRAKGANPAAFRHQARVPRASPPEHRPLPPAHVHGGLHLVCHLRRRGRTPTPQGNHQAAATAAGVVVAAQVHGWPLRRALA